MKAINIDGQNFGYLTALEQVIFTTPTNGRSYLCTCICGQEVIRKVSNLRKGGNNQSCGCKYYSYYEDSFDLTGQKLGDLLISKRLGTHKSSKSVLYLCECICGNSIKLTSKTLQRNKIKNCGCKMIPGKKLSGDQAIFNKNMSSYKSSAKRKKLPFLLTNEQCRKLCNDNCFYCDIEPSNIFTHKKNIGEFIHNGIDRLDSSKGYTTDNVVSCCAFCNYKKRETPYNDFINWISKVYNNCQIKK